MPQVAAPDGYVSGAVTALRAGAVGRPTYGRTRACVFDDLITQVTNDLVTAIEAGADSWTMPWHTIATTAQPRSIDQRPCRGLNALVLHGAERGWTSGTWATYLGWQRHDAQVRRGESRLMSRSGLTFQNLRTGIRTFCHPIFHPIYGRDSRGRSGTLSD